MVVVVDCGDERRGVYAQVAVVLVPTGKTCLEEGAHAREQAADECATECDQGLAHGCIIALGKQGGSAISQRDTPLMTALSHMGAGDVAGVAQVEWQARSSSVALAAVP